jgi:5,10-methylenetetrahydromethanopterin reductase
MTGPKTLTEYIVPTLREAAAAAGRPEGAVRVVAALPICVTDDVAATRAQAAEQLALYAQLASYRAMLDREGVAGPEDIALIGSETTVSERIAELAIGGVDECAALVFARLTRIWRVRVPCCAPTTYVTGPQRLTRRLWVRYRVPVG